VQLVARDEAFATANLKARDAIQQMGSDVDALVDVSLYSEGRARPPANRRTA
jgi:hypothetical protein